MWHHPRAVSAEAQHSSTGNGTSTTMPELIDGQPDYSALAKRRHGRLATPGRLERGTVVRDGNTEFLRLIGEIVLDAVARKDHEADR